MQIIRTIINPRLCSLTLARYPGICRTKMRIPRVAPPRIGFPQLVLMSTACVPTLRSQVTQDPCLPIARHHVRAVLRGNGPATVTHGERGNLRPPGCSRDDAVPGRPPLRLRSHTTCLHLPSDAARTGPAAEVHPSAARAARRYVPSRRVAAADCDARSGTGVRVHPGAAFRRVGSPASVGGARVVSQVHCLSLLHTAGREEVAAPASAAERRA